MKIIHKLIVLTCIYTNVNAQPDIGDTFEGGIIYDMVFHLNENIIEIEIVQMQNHLFGTIIDVQNLDDELSDGWRLPTFDDMLQISESRHILNDNHLFTDFSIDYSYWTSDHGELGQIVVQFNGDPLDHIVSDFINDDNARSYLRLVQSIDIVWGNVTESTEDTDNPVCDDDVNHNQLIHHLPHHIDLRLLEVSDFPDSSCLMTVTGNTSYSQNNYGNSSPDDIYQFEVTTSGTYEFSTCGSDYDTYLRIYDVNMNQLAENDDVCNLQSTVEISLAEGIYYLLVEGYSTSSGNYILSTNCNFTNANSCLSEEVIDCDGSGECFSESWINDGYCDGPEQIYGADLSCYDNDGGDCNESITCENDDSSTDTYGDSCTGWYDTNEYPGSIGCEGAYDSDVFNASEQCCVCQGGQGGQRLTAPTFSKKDRQSNICVDISLLFDSNINLLTLVVNDFNEDKLFNYEMYDLLGKRLFMGQLQSVETVLPIASLSPGVYLLRVNTLNNKTLKTLKFIKK